MSNYSKNIKNLSLIIGMACSTSLSFAQEKDNKLIGLYDIKDFKLTTGKCNDCAVLPQALWYFEKEPILVANDIKRISSLSGINAQEDIKDFYKNNKGQPDNSLPSIVWTGSPNVINGKLSEDGKTLTAPDGTNIKFSVVPKISTNLSYYNDKSIKYFGGKEITARGILENDRFIARSVWLKDFNINSDNIEINKKKEKIIDLVRKKDNQQFESKILWSKSGKSIDIANKPILGFILNGAQGDDDEAHGGHFAVATGHFGANGEWNNWMVNNFYGLNSFSEKGITASILPMDSYQADLNSGQSWYRPTYMLVAVLKDKKSSQLYQESINRVFNHFYKHNFEYNHALANCAGINVETFRSLGWNIPKKGAESKLKASVALPYISLKDKSINNGKKAFDYLNAEMSDLYPLVAFDAIGNDLLNRIVKGEKPKNDFEQTLMNDIEEIIYIKLPQFPSSRVIGQAPIASLAEYMKRVPENKKDWKIIPVEPRVFPKELKDAKIKVPLNPSDYAFYIYMAIGAIVGIFLIRIIWNKLKHKQIKID